MIPLLTLLLAGCPGGVADLPLGGGDDGGSPSSSAEAGGDEGGAKAQLIRPGTLSGPAEPDNALSRGDCDTMADGGKVQGPDCITGTLSCDQTVIGHTRGGVNEFDTKFWEKKFCWPATTNHNSGDERVYRLTFTEPRMRAHLTLDTPCADLDMMAMTWNGDTCPSRDHSIHRCESGLKPGTKREKTVIVSQVPESWLVVVEGSGDAEGAFALTAQCEKW